MVMKKNVLIWLTRQLKKTLRLMRWDLEMSGMTSSLMK